MREVTILGSTGSIGTRALDVVSRRESEFRVVTLAARGSNPQLLARQILDCQPRTVALALPTAVQDLQLALYSAAKERGWTTGDLALPKITAGPNAIAEAAAQPVDVVLNGTDGAAGLLPTLAALQAGNTVALANKESLIIGGDLITSAAADGQLVAVDSEHSAIAQCLRSGRATEVDRIILTASGGPFRGRTRDELAAVTPAEALAHPTWDMGKLVTTNSATLVNKGLELLEAHLLFDVPIDRITVVVHPQSIVHSMVQFRDGSTIAQASPPDMRLPIALGLSWPDRLADVVAPCDWSTAANWTFEPVDEDVFAGLRIARTAGTAGGTAPAVMNGANEACVAAFHDGALSFLGICDTVAVVLDEHLRDGHVTNLSVDAVLAADRWARERAAELIAEGAR